MNATGKHAFEIELDLSGSYTPYRAATRWDPPEGGEVEDLAIEDVGVISASRVDGKFVFKTTSIMEGVNKASPDVQRLLSNLLDLVRQEAEEAVAAEALGRAA